MSIAAFLLVAGSVLSAELKTVPTFENCSLYWSGERLPENHAVQICEAGTENWNAALPLSISPDYPDWRGSVFGLKESTQYDVRIMDGTNLVAAQSFKTWTSSPPIAKRYTLKDLSPQGYQFVFSERGEPDGWILISGTPELNLLDGALESEETLLFTNAAYVIFENITVRGGIKHGITIRDSENIRILNCDIAGFGRVGDQALYYGGNGRYYDGKTRINNDAGVNLDDSGNVVIERCFIHSPRNTANPWRFSHPEGPNAVFVKSRGGTVIRYNDFTGSDLRRWNDAVEGWNNTECGFLRDADIYGNLFAFANDDGIELDGLQMNIRTYGNRIEQTYCGISTAPCMTGPSYVFRNLISNLGDEDGFSESAVKNNYSVYGYGRLFFYNNTAVSKYNVGSPFGTLPDNAPEFMAQIPGYVKVVTRNNIFSAGKTPLTLSWPVRYTSDADYDLLHSEIPAELEAVRETYQSTGQCLNAIFGTPEFRDTLSGDYTLAENSVGKNAGVFIPGISAAGNDAGAGSGIPFRPLPVLLNKGRIHLDENPATVTAAVDPAADVSLLNFKICKPAGCDWFSVTPESGELIPGQTQNFTVRLISAKLPEDRRGAGTFLIRFANGLSRPVLVFTDDVPAPAAIQLPEGGWSQLIEAETIAARGTDPAISAGASGGAYAVMKKSGAPFCVTFTVPAAGNYQVCLRLKTLTPPGGNITTTITAAGATESFLMRADERWMWCGVVAGGYGKNKNRHYSMLRLAAGEHTFSFLPEKNVAVDAVLITDSALPVQ